jgi:hypothetical protein
MSLTPPDSNAESARRSDEDSKKRYEAPRLTDYGPISKLTQTGGITTMDMGNFKQACL